MPGDFLTDDLDILFDIDTFATEIYCTTRQTSFNGIFDREYVENFDSEVAIGGLRPTVVAPTGRLPDTYAEGDEVAIDGTDYVLVSWQQEYEPGLSRWILRKAS